MPLTLLVVPHYHGDREVPVEYKRWLATRVARGDELALHGYTHVDEARAPANVADRVRRRVYTAGEGEFAQLTREEAAQRLALGRRWFAEQGWAVEGFVAPAWLVSAGTWQALRESDFTYTTTLSRFHVLNRRSLYAPCVVYSTRSAWRRQCSRAWNAAVTAVFANRPLIRFGFHPADVRYPDVMAHSLKLLRKLLRDRAPLSKGAYARMLGYNDKPEASHP